MQGYLSQEDFFPNYFEDFEDGIKASPENLELVRDFLLEKWRERAAEGGVPDTGLPIDLSDSCKFSALFGSVVFAADIGGNWNHVYNLIDGEIVDINATAADVLGRPDIHRHDAGFIGGNDFRESASSCVTRVSAWVNEFSVLYSNRLAAETGATRSGPSLPRLA